MNFCKLSGKDLNTRSGLAARIHGIVCVMNRFYKNGTSQAIYEMFNVDFARQHWNIDQFFWFLSDIDILLDVESMATYRKLIYDVSQYIACNKDKFVED